MQVKATHVPVSLAFAKMKHHGGSHACAMRNGSVFLAAHEDHGSARPEDAAVANTARMAMGVSSLHPMKPMHG